MGRRRGLALPATGLLGLLGLFGLFGLFGIFGRYVYVHNHCDASGGEGSGDGIYMCVDACMHLRYQQMIACEVLKREIKLWTWGLVVGKKSESPDLLWALSA